MKNKEKNTLMYVTTIIVIIIVYIVIYLFGMSVRRDIYEEYDNNAPKPPVNSIMCNHHEEKLIFEYQNDEKNYIDLTNQFPTTDEDGKNFVGDKYTQDFKLILNEKARGVSYTITAERLAESDLDNTWVKAYLTANGIGVNNSIREDRKIKTLDEYGNYQNNPNEKVLYSGIISEQEAQRGYKNFTFRMWISEDVKVVNEEYPTKTIKLKINVYAQKKY